MSKVLKRNWIPVALIVAYVIGASVWVSRARGATAYYVSTTGSGIACSIGSPCSLYTGWCGNGCSAFNPQPGDTVWIQAGDYKLSVGGNGGRGSAANGFCNHTNGVTYRNYQNGKVTIDMNADLTGAGQCTSAFGDFPASTLGNNTYWGLYIYNSNTSTARPSAATNVGPVGMNQFLLSQRGSRLINCFIWDGTDGVLKNAGASGSFGGGNLLQGNFEQYSGWPSTGNGRGSGHSLYVKNPDADGEAIDRTVIDGNIGLRAFDVGTQFYSTTDQISYITMTNSIEAAQGICSSAAACTDPSSWPAVACCANTYYLGTSGGVSTSCYTAGTKNWYKGVFDGNWAIGGANGVTFGGSKGVCNSQITNNYFFQTGGQSVTCTTNQGWWTPVGAITGNTFYAPMNGGGCPAPAFNLTNYPSNTVNAGLPSSGKIFKYWADPNETGRGWVAVANFDGSANVTINLDSMGGYAGEQYRIQQWQDVDPWDNTKDLTTGTCGATCGTISVSTTAPSIRQPAFTRADGSTPFPKPPDLGPTYVVYLLYPRWEAGAGTPTPTNTSTNTPTATNTNTPTNTATFTPTNAAVATNTPSFTPVFTATNTLTPSNTPTVTPTVPPQNGTQFGVGSCTASPPMGITPDASAISGNHATSTVANQGDLVCKFYVPVDGTYKVWVHVSAQAPTGDSFFIEVDGDNNFNSLTPTVTANPTNTPTAVPAKPHVFDAVEQSQPCTGGSPSCQYSPLSWSGNFVWNPLNDRQATCGSCSGNYTERDLTLTVAGNPHTIVFRNREFDATTSSSAYIDYVYMTNCLSCDAPNISPTPTPNPAALCRQYFRCNRKAGYKYVPCNLISDGAIPKSQIPCPWQ